MRRLNTPSKLILFCLLLIASRDVRSDEKEASGFLPKTYVSTSGFSLPYRLRPPANIQVGKKFPLVVYLHSEYSRGRDNSRQLREILPWSKTEFQSKRPCYLLAPQCPTLKEVIQVFGYNNALGFIEQNSYAGSEKKWKHFLILVGKHYSLNAKVLFFMNDDYGKESHIDSRYRNVKVYEAGAVAKAKPLIFKKEAFSPYAGGGSGAFPLIEDAGATLHFIGDTRQKIAFPYVVTKKTCIEFDFKSDFQGSTHGFGFDDDDSLLNYRWAQDVNDKNSLQTPEMFAPMAATLELIPNLIRQNPNIDASRIYLIGGGMGGGGVWNALARRPDLFAAGVPISGTGDFSTVPKMKTTPIWFFHGATDGGDVSIHAMMIALANEGGDPLDTEYRESGYDCWDKALAEPRLPEWLFLQKRETSPPTAPTRLKIKSATPGKVELVWDRVVNPGVIRGYRVLRDGGEIANVKEPSFIDWEMGENEIHSYQVQISTLRGAFSVPSEQAWAKTGKDKSPLKVAGVSANGGPFTIEVRFDKAIYPAQGASVENYRLNHGLNISKATLSKDMTVVNLTCSALQLDTPYELSISGIRDASSSANRLEGTVVKSFNYAPRLSAYWKFDEGEGNIGFDGSGNSNNVFFRSVDWVRGKTGKALIFDAIADHTAYVRDSKSLDAKSELSVSIWVKKSGDYYRQEVMIAKNRYYDRRLQFILDLDASHRVRAIVGTDSGLPFVIGKRLDAKEWHHLAMTYRAGKLELYIDGVSQGTATGGKLNSLAEGVTIGGGYQGRDAFKGAIDEIRIYSVALSEAEIVQLSRER